MRTGRTSGSCCRYAATRGWPVESEACLEGLPRRLLGRTGRADRVEEGVSSEADLWWHWMRCVCAPVRAWPGELKRRDSVDKVSLPLCVGWREETVVGSFPHFFLRPRAVHSIQHGTTHDSTHHRHIPLPTTLEPRSSPSDSNEHTQRYRQVRFPVHHRRRISRLGPRGAAGCSEGVLRETGGGEGQAEDPSGRWSERVSSRSPVAHDPSSSYARGSWRGHSMVIESRS
jgi:hypothetical protein